MKQPKTVEEFMALPERPLIEYDIEVVNGRTLLIPRATKVMAFYHEPDTIFYASAPDGSLWMLGTTENGFCRRRRY